MKKPGMIVAIEPLRHTSESRRIDRPTKPAAKLVIGIDPGTRTGIAWRVDNQQMQVATKSLYDAMDIIEDLVKQYGVAHTRIWIEDARINRPVFDRGQNHAASLKIAQNVGSVKRDTGLLEEHCKRQGVTPLMVRPSSSKWDRSMMRAATGITKPCSQNARDAAKLISGR